MKVGLFSPYLKTLGGGERYLLTIAQFFLNQGHEVTFYTDSPVSAAEISNRFNLDLKNIKFRPDVFFNENGFIKRVHETSKYDWFVFLSDGSIPFSLARNNILHFQVPLKINARNSSNKLKLSRYNEVICNSEFTKSFIDASFGVKSKVVYPPVAVEDFFSGKKEKVILSVGRFFFTDDPRVPSDPKKHLIMVDNFITWHKKNSKNGWKLILAGGSNPQSVDLLTSLKKRIGSLPIEIITDPDFPKMRDLFSKASIYWHAAGFGEDLSNHPDRAEHFGITTVEAMASGAVPIVFNGGGQAEIVTSGENGYLWNTSSELQEMTSRVIKDSSLWERLSHAAKKESQKYSTAKFFENLKAIVNE